MERNHESWVKWCTLFSTKPTKELNKREKYLKKMLEIYDISSERWMINFVPSEELDSVAYAVWEKVSSQHTYRISPALCGYIGNIISKGNFGIIAMVTNILQYYYLEGQFAVANMEAWNKIKPCGIDEELTDDAWRELWDEQKVKRDSFIYSDNGVDYALWR